MSDITRHPRPDGRPATQHLDAAAALIRAGYCLEANAQDARRRVCPVMAPEATAWSLYGALLRATGGDDFRCQTSTAFELVVKCLQDFHSLRPNEIGWAGAIVLYEKQQVVIRQKDGPVGSPPSSGWGHLCPCRAMRAATPPYWESTTLLGVGHLCHVESRGPDRRDTYAQPYSPLPRLLVASCAKRNEHRYSVSERDNDRGDAAVYPRGVQQQRHP
jgi:hypothetical protein